MQQTPSTMSLDASGEVFTKTLALFCALREHGCPLTQNESSKIVENYESEEVDFSGLRDSMTANDLITVLKDRRFRMGELPKCSGKLLFETDKYGGHFVW